MYLHECGSGCDGYVAAPSSPIPMQPPSTTAADPTQDASQHARPAGGEPLAIATIPWHLLGAMQCLARGDRAKDFHEALLAEPAKFSAALAATQTTVAAGSLIGRVLAFASGVTEPYYGGKWGLTAWPAGFPVRLQYNAPDLILTRTGLVVPWDWPLTTAGDLAAARSTAFGTNDPILDYVAATGDVHIGAFMLAADDAVTFDYPSSAGDEFAGVISQVPDAEQRNVVAKTWIARRARTTHRYSGPAYPGASLRVDLDPERDPQATQWLVDTESGGLTLRLGTNGVVQREKRILFNPWPCGALAG